MLTPTNCTDEVLKKQYPNGFYLLSPDGFTLVPFPEKYKLLEDAKADYLVWKERYEAQGNYSSVSRGRIPLENLWDNMIIHDEPFCIVR